MTDEKATDKVKTQKDYGSEQLPTNAVENPWDVPVQPDLPSPSGQVTGDGEAGTVETPVESVSSQNTNPHE